MDNDKTTDSNSNNDASSVSRHRHRHHSRQVRKWLISPLWIFVVLESLAIAGLGIWLILMRLEISSHQEHEKTMSLNISDCKTELEGLRWEFNEYKNQQHQNRQ
jgi:hypothetical protein